MKHVVLLSLVLCSRVLSGQTPAITNVSYNVVQESAGKYLLAVSWVGDSPKSTYTIAGAVTLSGGAPFTLPPAPVTPMDPTSTRFEKRYDWGAASATSIPDTVEALTFTITPATPPDSLAFSLPINVAMTKQVISLLNRPDPILLPATPQLNVVVGQTTDTTLRLSVVAHGGDARVQATARPTAAPGPGKSAATVVSDPLTLVKNNAGELILRGLTSSEPYTITVDEISPTYGGHKPEQVTLAAKMLDPVPRPTLTLASLTPVLKTGGVAEIKYRTANASRVLATIEKIGAGNTRTPVGSGPIALKAGSSPQVEETAKIPAALEAGSTYVFRLWAEHAHPDIASSPVIETTPVPGLKETLFNDLVIDLSDDFQLIPQGMTESVVLTGSLSVGDIPVTADCDAKKCSFKLVAVQAALKPLIKDDKNNPNAGQIKLSITAKAPDQSERSQTRVLTFQTPNTVSAKGLKGNSGKIATGLRSAATIAANDPNVSSQVKGIGNLLLALVSMFL